MGYWGMGPAKEINDKRLIQVIHAKNTQLNKIYNETLQVKVMISTIYLHNYSTYGARILNLNHCPVFSTTSFDRYGLHQVL